MKNKVYEFNQKYSAYFKGSIDDEEMTDYVSQPFWHSLHLSKKRLAKNGLTMEMDIRTKNPNVQTISHDENNITEGGVFSQSAKITKKIKKNNKIIYKSKNKEICLTGAMKVKGDGENAICPHCGNLGKISSYSDGCDYCHSKYKVSNFDEKISSFTTEPNGRSILAWICGKTFIGFVIVGVLVIAAIFISFIIGLIATTVGNSETTVGYSMTIFLILSEAYKPMYTIALFVGITLFIILIVAISFYKEQRFVPTRTYTLLKRKIPDFSPDDFSQNLEYKLRNIHFAERDQDAQPFASFDINPVIDKYSNVIECFIHTIKFDSLRETSDKFIVNLTVNLRLTRLKGKKARMENEKLHLTLSRKKDIKEHNISGILEFTCNSCGAGIDMFKGGFCEYCGNQLDYSHNDWIIDKYYSNVNEQDLIDKTDHVLFGKNKYIEHYKKIRLLMISIICGTIALELAVIGFVNKDIFHSMFHYSQYIELTTKEFNSLPTVEELWEDESQWKLVKEETEHFSTIKYYDFKGDVGYLVSLFLEEMTKIDYTMHVETNHVIFTKNHKFDDVVKGCYILSISLEDEYLRVEYTIEDNLSNYLDDMEENEEESSF